MEESTADECDGNYKNKNITVYGNATVVEQKGLTAVVAVKASARVYGNAAAVETPI